MSQPAFAPPAPTPFLHRASDWWLEQVKHVLPPTIFFFVGFNLIVLTKRLILQEQGIEFSGFFTATAAALLVGKAVLVTDSLPFMRRFDGAPMIQPILFKSAIYWLCVLIVRLAERLVHFLAAGGVIADFPEHFVQHFSWPRFLSIQIWLTALFLIYVTIHELNVLIGDGELFRLFFRWRSSEAKLTRRQRMPLAYTKTFARPSLSSLANVANNSQYQVADQWPLIFMNDDTATTTARVRCAEFILDRAHGKPAFLQDPNRDPDFVPLAERLKWYVRRDEILAAEGKVVQILPPKKRALPPATDQALPPVTDQATAGRAGVCLQH